MRRLTPATLTVVMFGVIGLLVVGYFAKTLFAVKEKPAAPTLREVPMAVTDIKPGTVITADHLGMGRYDRTKLTPDVLLANRVIVGRVAREPIKAATPIKAGQLYQPGELPPLEIGPGMRAVSVEVGDGVAMVDGLIKPGDAVDVLFTAQNGVTSTNFQGGVTMRLFEGVKVLAINRNFSQGKVDRGNNHVTLELTVAQANIMVLAKDRGKITLTYNPNGKGNGGLALSNAERVTLYEILGLVKSDPTKPPFTTEIFRGSKRTAIRFDENGRLFDRQFQSGANSQDDQYQLPSSNPDPAPAPAVNNSFKGANLQNRNLPDFNTVPSLPVNQMVAPQNVPMNSRNSPTAQIIQPRN